MSRTERPHVHRPAVGPAPRLDRHGYPWAGTAAEGGKLRYIARRNRKRLRDPESSFWFELRFGISGYGPRGWSRSPNLPGAQVALAQTLQTGTLATL